MRETFATVIVWRSYRAVYFYARERACTSMIVAACPPDISPPSLETNASRQKSCMRVCIHVLHIFVARSANIIYECLYVRGLKREDSMNIWQISGEGRGRDDSMYVVVRDTNTFGKKTLELALPSPRMLRINASPPRHFVRWKGEDETKGDLKIEIRGKSWR